VSAETAGGSKRVYRHDALGVTVTTLSRVDEAGTDTSPNLVYIFATVLTAASHGRRG